VAIAVVGAAGTLGAILRERLDAVAVELRGTDPADERIIPELADADVVVNVGGPRVRPGLGWRDYFREHVGTTARVARSMRAGARLVHVSSTAVYGARGERLGPASREEPTRFPAPAYACAKLAAESLARALGAERGLRVTVLRPSMVYGAGIDSALATLRRFHRRGVHLRLAPAHLRQHLVHVDLLASVVERVARGAAPLEARPLLVADPFVLTNADLAPAATRARLPLVVDVRAAATLGRTMTSVVGAAPLALQALGVLGLDNEFDVEATWPAAAVDPRAFDRRSTFDAYWSE
jgi:UDP-glucose 4-epimerase